MLAHSLIRFHEASPEIKIILVLPEQFISYWQKQEISRQIPHRVVAGGKERFHSVKNALSAIQGTGDKGQGTEKSLVSIHDAARPLVSVELIRKTFTAAAQFGSAIPVTEVPYSLRKQENDKWIAADRADYRIVQTPQVFNLENLFSAYEQEFSSNFTDDASVYEATGNEVHLIEGESANIKVTTPEDLDWVNYRLSK